MESYKFTRKPRGKSQLSASASLKNDIFKDVWESDVLTELKNNNEITATEILTKLICKYPKKFHAGHIRTFQRRVAIWRELKRNEITQVN